MGRGSGVLMNIVRQKRQNAGNSENENVNASYARAPQPLLLRAPQVHRRSESAASPSRHRETLHRRSEINATDWDLQLRRVDNTSPEQEAKIDTVIDVDLSSPDTGRRSRATASDWDPQSPRVLVGLRPDSAHTDEHRNDCPAFACDARIEGESDFDSKPEALGSRMQSITFREGSESAGRIYKHGATQQTQSSYLSSLYDPSASASAGDVFCAGFQEDAALDSELERLIYPPSQFRAIAAPQRTAGCKTPDGGLCSLHDEPSEFKQTDAFRSSQTPVRSERGRNPRASAAAERPRPPPPQDASAPEETLRSMKGSSFIVLQHEESGKYSVQRRTARSVSRQARTPGIVAVGESVDVAVNRAKEKFQEGALLHMPESLRLRSAIPGLVATKAKNTWRYSSSAIPSGSGSPSEDARATACREGRPRGARAPAAAAGHRNRLGLGIENRERATTTLENDILENDILTPMNLRAQHCQSGKTFEAWVCEDQSAGTNQLTGSPCLVTKRLPPGTTLHTDTLHTDTLHTDTLHTDSLHTDSLHTVTPRGCSPTEPSCQSLQYSRLGTASGSNRNACGISRSVRSGKDSLTGRSNYGVRAGKDTLKDQQTDKAKSSCSLRGDKASVEDSAALVAKIRTPARCGRDSQWLPDGKPPVSGACASRSCSRRSMFSLHVSPARRRNDNNNFNDTVRLFDSGTKKQTIPARLVLERLSRASLPPSPPTSVLPSSKTQCTLIPPPVPMGRRSLSELS